MRIKFSFEMDPSERSQEDGIGKALIDALNRDTPEFVLVVDSVIEKFLIIESNKTAVRGTFANRDEYTIIARKIERAKAATHNTRG